MKSFAQSLFSRRFFSALSALACVTAGATAAHGQSLTLNFRFDGTNSLTQSISSADNGHTFTIDVWATVVGAAPATTTAQQQQLGLEAIRFRGISSQTDNAAFSTGAGIGVVAGTATAFESGGGSFAQGTVVDYGSTTNGDATHSPPTAGFTTLDGVKDFGSSATNGATNAVANASGLSMQFGGTAGNGQASSTQGWEWMVGQYTFTIGNVIGAPGSRTSFVPVVGQGSTSTVTTWTATGQPVGATATHGTFLTGTPVSFVVAAPAGTTISVTAGANASVLKGGSVGIGATLNNTGSVALNGGDYTFTASSAPAANIGYSAAAPSTATTGIGASSGQPFSFTATTTAGPGGTPIGLAQVTFTGANAGASTKITNSPQTGQLTINVGGATADNSNQPGVYGPALTAPVASGGGYGGLESAVVGLQGSGGSNAAVLAPPYLGGRAVMLAGANSAATGRTVSMAWRTRLVNTPTNGLLDETHGGPGSALQATTSTTGLVSDVVNLTGLEISGNTTDPYVLDMSYNPALLPKGGPPAIEQGLANNKLIYMVSPVPGPDDGHSQYGNTVFLNSGNVVVNSLSPDYGAVSSWSAYATAKFGTTNPTNAQLASDMGAWGVDTGAHEVWAIVNHNSTFAVVPEPSTLLLAGLGLLGLVGLRRRMTKVA